MTESSKPDVPNWSMDLVEKIQATPGFRATKKFITGSDAPNYRKVKEVMSFTGERAELIEAGPDPEANLLAAVFRKLLKKTAVVGADASELNELIENVSGEVAAAYTYNGITRAGKLWNGLNDLGYIAEKNLYTVRMKQGPNIFRVGLGLYQPENDLLVIPRLEVFQEYVPIESIDCDPRFGALV